MSASSTTAEARSEAWLPTIRAIGTLAPVDGVLLSADADGTVVKITVDSGSAVQAGDLLVELDTTVEVAQRDSAAARAELAKINLGRAEKLKKDNSIADSDYDAAVNAVQQANADVAALQALIDKKMIRAPFAGRVGIRQINLGQYFARGRPLLALEKLDPIYVNFSLPQQQLAQVKLGQKTTVTVDAFPGGNFEATITALDSQVDATSRNIAVQATLPNPQEQLRPGMFAQVEIQLPAAAPAIVVPATAIQYASYGDAVFIVEQITDEKKPKKRSSSASARRSSSWGATRGDLVSINDGVKAGEQVVTSGGFQTAQGRCRAGQQCRRAHQRGRAQAAQYLSCSRHRLRSCLRLPPCSAKVSPTFLIRKPVIALVVNLVILVVGVVAYFKLNTRQYPRSDSAMVTVTTVYFGASADTVRGFITTQLEQSIASADGIDYMESSSAAGLSTINVYLRLNYDTNAALAQISSKIDQVRNDLPPEAEAPTIAVSTSDSQFASMYLSFYSDQLDQNQITDYLSRMVQPRLAAIPGVQQAGILGGRVFAMRIWLKPDELAARGLEPERRPRRALQANNSLSAVGATKGSMLSVSLVANTDLKNVEQFRQMPVATKNGVVIRLSDVANVELGAEDYNQEVRFGGKTATFMGVWVLPTESTLEVIKRVRAAIPEIQRGLPAGLECFHRLRRHPIHRRRPQGDHDDADGDPADRDGGDLPFHGLAAFGRDSDRRHAAVACRAALFADVRALGFTVNLLTLLAIVLAVGIVVDDAIVVVENIERHIREGLKPVDAAIAGARELVGPVISMTITLAAVYAPIAFQGGLTGALFREFALTLAGAVAVSGFVALTLSPMMSAYLLKNHDAEDQGLSGRINRLFDRLRVRYEHDPRPDAVAA